MSKVPAHAEMITNQGRTVEPTNLFHQSVPDDWKKVPLAEVVKIIRGISFPKDAKISEPRDGYVACLRTTNVQKEVEWKDLWFVPEEHVRRVEQYVEPGDILISTANSLELVGKVAPVTSIPVKATLGAFISMLRPVGEVNKKFIYYQLAWSDTQDRIRSIASTTTNISNVSTKKLSNLEVVIAPPDQQKCIVAEIERQFSRLDEAVANLKRVKANLKRYKAAVLKAAVEGKLTEGWRTTHLDVEPASELLKRILAERRAKWNGKGKYREPKAADPTELPSLPDCWMWTTLDSLLREPLRNGHSAKASGTGTGLRAFTLSALTEGDFSERNTKLTVADAGKVEDLWAEPGDIYVERSNTPELVGLARLYTGPSHFAFIPDLFIRVRVMLQVSVRFIELSLLSERGRAFFRSKAQGIAGTMPKIDQTVVESAPIALPSLAEQEQIVSEVERRLSVVEDLEKMVDANFQRAERLRQAILRNAFCGRLFFDNPTSHVSS